jgi:hypothetical protein
MVLDSAYYQAAMQGSFSGEYAYGGPLTNITFELYPPLTPLQPVKPSTNSGSSLQPLPPLQPADSSGSSLQPLPPLQPADSSGSSLQPLPPLQPADNSGSSLKPLPPLKPTPPTLAIGSGSMNWNASTIKDLFTYYDGRTTQADLDDPSSLDFTVTLFDNCNGIVKIRIESTNFYFKARLVKGVTLVDVK